MSKNDKREETTVPAEPDVTPNEMPDEPNTEPDPTDENRVVNNGDVSDPGNSGSIGTVGTVEGRADKPNG